MTERQFASLEELDAFLSERVGPDGIARTRAEMKRLAGEVLAGRGLTWADAHAAGVQIQITARIDDEGTLDISMVLVPRAAETG
jgi:hypothetical protein